MASPKAPGDRTGGARSAGAAGRARAAVARRSRVLAAALAAFALPAATAEAADPTPVQAVDANAEFLAWAPPPATPVKVCVVDTGVDLTTDVAGRVVKRYSMYGGTLDDVGGGGIPKHGTWVAGVIASGRDDGGSVGIWPQAQIVSVRVFPDANSGSSVPAYLSALNRCRLEGAMVANLSLSGLGQATGPQLTELENKIMDLQTNWEMNVVAAAGNSNGGAVGYPAAFPSVFAVGAGDMLGMLCGLSARGPEIDLSALGCDVGLSLPGAQTAAGRGTSYAAPVVSAVLAALRAYKPSLTVAEAERLLLDTAKPGGAGRRLDAAAAFRAAGLTPYVTAPDPLPPAAPAAPTGGAEPNAAPAAANGGPPPVMQHVQAISPGDPLASLGVRRPKLRASTYRRGVLTVVVSGVPDFGRAVFTVDRRTYSRASGKLRIRLKRPPKRISVVTEIPDVGRTAPLRVKVGAAARSATSNRRLKRGA